MCIEQLVLRIFGHELGEELRGCSGRSEHGSGSTAHLAAGSELSVAADGCDGCRAVSRLRRRIPETLERLTAG